MYGLSRLARSKYCIFFFFSFVTMKRTPWTVETAQGFFYCPSVKKGGTALFKKDNLTQRGGEERKRKWVSEDC